MPTSPGTEAALPVCDSCGAPAADTAPVHRVYVTPRAWDLAGDGADDDGPAERVDVLDEVETWCFPCRSQYPHQPLTA
jgi:hypothetical protein